jgi:hypothetical protein
MGLYRRHFLLVLTAFGLMAPAIAADRAAPTPYRIHVDMKTFMAHIITPAAAVIWRSNGVLIDADGEHDLAPRSDEDWEQIVSGTAALAESTNALMIPGRAVDKQWNFYVGKLAKAAATAYQAAEAHDLPALSRVSDKLDGICAACHQHYGLE